MEVRRTLMRRVFGAAASPNQADPAGDHSKLESAVDPDAITEKHIYAENEDELTRWRGSRRDPTRTTS